MSDTIFYGGILALMMAGALAGAVYFFVAAFRGAKSIGASVAGGPGPAASRLGLQVQQQTVAGGLAAGTYRGVPVQVRWGMAPNPIDGMGPNACTAVVALLARPLGLGLEVAEAGAVMRFAAGHVGLGHPQLDSMLQIRANDEHRARQLLTGAAPYLLHAAKVGGRLHVDDAKVAITLDAITGDQQVLVEALEATTGLARALA